jgi:hypothetical protein
MEQNTPNARLMSGASIRESTRGPLNAKTIDIANYIADMVLELRNMAKSAKLDTLLGLLEVTFYEAFSIANRVEIPPAELERLREMERAAREG